MNKLLALGTAAFIGGLSAATAFAEESNASARPSCSIWKDWKDPLSQLELDALMKKSSMVEKSLVERSRQARKPMESSVKFVTPISFLGRTFGEVRPVSTNSCCSFRNKVVAEYFPWRKLEERYFAFDHVYEHMSPCSHRLHTLRFFYRDYAYGGAGPYPLGRYRTGRDLLKEGRAIIADLEKRLGAPLQKLQLMSPLWPYRPGVKMSTCWSGVVPECYLCDESIWTTARHAEATSSTNLGRVHVKLTLMITYYDEFSLTLDISDGIESKRCKDEYEREARDKGKEQDEIEIEVNI